MIDTDTVARDGGISIVVIAIYFESVLFKAIRSMLELMKDEDKRAKPVVLELDICHI